MLDVAKLEASEIAVETISNLVTNMKKLVNNPKFSDVIFIVEGYGDLKEFFQALFLCLNL